MALFKKNTNKGPIVFFYPSLKVSENKSALACSPTHQKCRLPQSFGALLPIPPLKKTIPSWYWKSNSLQTVTSEQQNKYCTTYTAESAIQIWVTYRCVGQAVHSVSIQTLISGAAEQTEAPADCCSPYHCSLHTLEERNKQPLSPSHSLSAMRSVRHPVPRKTMILLVHLARGRGREKKKSPSAGTASSWCCLRHWTCSA